MASGLSIFHFVDRCGGFDGFLQFLRDLGHGEPMYKLARARGMDPAYVSRILNEYFDWKLVAKPAAKDAIDILMSEHKEAYDDTRRALACEENLAEIIKVDFRGTRA